MPNSNAVTHAANAADKAQKARGMLRTFGGAIEPENGQAGMGLLYLAEAVQALALAVQALAQQQD